MSPLFVRWCGGRKRALQTFIIAWGILVLIFAVTRSWPVLAVIVMLNGFAFSVLFALSRAFYAVLIPKEKQATFFSVYVLFERTSSILGPLLWSATAAAFVSYGDDRYRFSVVLLAVLILLSLIPLRYVQEVEGDR
jgi:UMF1 family MFS transporter